MSVSANYLDECKAWNKPVKVTPEEKTILRDLAKLVAEIAALPIQSQRTALWKKHNSLEPCRPLILARPEAGWLELVPESILECSDPYMRQWETYLRRLIFRHENIHDDWPITDFFNIGWVISWGNYGIEEKVIHGDDRGSFTWVPTIKTPEDIKKLNFRSIDIDKKNTADKVEVANDILGDILKVRTHGRLFNSCGLTAELIFFRGLQQSMMDMYDNPSLVHDIMAFLRDAMIDELTTYEKQNVLTLNNGPDDWTPSGGVGATDELPAEDFAGSVRLKDMWVFSESQEFIGVSPAQFEEFVLPYQLPIMKLFGKVNYGCCEPLDKKFDILFKSIPNLRRLSISPWCDRQIAADRIKRNYIYSYKPNPSFICSPQPDYDSAMNQLAETMKIAKDCCLEIVMKDTHTFKNDPQRIKKWTTDASSLAQEI